MNLQQLSPRERQVLNQRALGLPYKQIADVLGISPSTTKAHLCRVFQKLKVRSSLEAVRFLR